MEEQIANHPVKQTTNEPANQTADQPTETTNQPAQTTNEPDQTTNEPANQTTNEPANQTTNEPANQTTNQLTPDGAWCFFADPRALYYAGQYKRTYVSWLTSYGDVRIGFYDHEHEYSESFLVKAALQRDDHANPTLHIDADGRVTIFYSAHNGNAMYYRTTAQPETLATLSSERQLPVNTEGGKGYTYPNPVYLKQEKRLYLFWRGGNFKPAFSTTNDLENNDWSAARTLIDDRGQRPYIRFASNGEDAIDFACTDGHPNEEAYNSIYYARYSNGSIYRADGTKVKSASDLPLRLEEIDKVFDGPACQRSAWIWDVAVNKDNHPVLVYAVFVTPEDHRYYYSQWDGAQWQTNEITAAGSWFPQTAANAVEREQFYSGGLILNHADPSIVYLSRQVDGQFEIECWQTADVGKSWETAPVTASSAALQIRPFLSRHAAGSPSLLLWMSGEYKHYADYQTEIQMRLV
ncbi:hypothetical protein EBB07_01285 [Paenibacillaceae bacterium]|nr:hypothetical protein EBB07_01285 [Paenibacillaceae bacterium]